MTASGPQGPASGAAGAGPGGAPPSDEEVRAALEEQMRRLSVEDVLVQTIVTLVNLGARKLGLTAPPEDHGDDPGSARPDLGQAHMAIEGTRALLPLVPGDLGAIRDALSQLQVAYARAAQGAQAGGSPPAGAAGAESGQPPQPGGERPDPGPGEPPSAPASDPERERARSKIWTPPGA